MKKKQSQLLLIGLFILIAIYAVYLVISSSQKGTITDKPLSDFAIKDTSTVDQIVIKDNFGNEISVKRDESNIWWLNNGYKARKDAVDIILKTANRIRVQRPVAKSALENTLKKIAVKNKRVDFYQKGVLSKTYFVGNPTMDHYGTYMLLEIPRKGRSNEPFIMEIPGFNGNLESRFFTDAIEWRHTGLFNFDPANIRNVQFEDFESTDKSFQIDAPYKNTFELSDLKGNKAALFDTVKVQKYLINYKKIHFESFTRELSKEQKDSVMASKPRYKITVTGRGGEKKSVKLFNIKLSSPIEDAGNLVEVSRDKMYGLLPNNEMVLVQFYVFRKLLRSYHYFL